MTYNPADMTLWTGRVDSEEAGISSRWHQEVSSLPAQGAEAGNIALLGFACDEGVRRNKGRRGAKLGPMAVRQALANTAWHLEGVVYDAGDVSCDDSALEVAQNQLTAKVALLLDQGLKPIVLGGGHEVAWGSYKGIARHVFERQPDAHVGIINLDAHLDLRNPELQSSSGTPFRQIAEWCQAKHKPFHYYCLGVNETANTQALFDFAREQGVLWRLDKDCKLTDLETIRQDVADYLAQLDYLYLTICLDVFAASAAPGVSAPSVMGLEPVTGMQLMLIVLEEAEKADVSVVLADIAECNPTLDEEGRTAKLAARLVAELAQRL